MLVISFNGLVGFLMGRFSCFYQPILCYLNCKHVAFLFTFIIFNSHVCARNGLPCMLKHTVIVRKIVLIVRAWFLHALKATCSRSTVGFYMFCFLRTYRIRLFFISIWTKKKGGEKGSRINRYATLIVQLVNQCFCPRGTERAYCHSAEWAREKEG